MLNAPEIHTFAPYVANSLAAFSAAAAAITTTTAVATISGAVDAAAGPVAVYELFGGDSGSSDVGVTVVCAAQKKGW